jgi:hypothetical protein
MFFSVQDYICEKLALRNSNIGVAVLQSKAGAAVLQFCSAAVKYKFSDSSCLGVCF